MIPFPSGRFRLVLADPPWQFRDRANAGKRGAEHKYPCMDWREIARLPVPDICHPNCLLAMWWVGAMSVEAHKVVEAWGFRLVTMKGFTWAKLSPEGKVRFGTGHYTRANTEDCLFAVRGRPKRADAGVSQLIIAPRTRKHSEKPPEARDRLVRLMGDVPRIELFAGERAPGWEAWGFEVSHSEGNSDGR